MSASTIMSIVLLASSPTTVLTDAQAVTVAQTIGNYLGYAKSDARFIDYEVTDSGDNNPGYVTVQIRINSQTLFDLSLNKQTGQAADFTRCLVLSYPVIKSEETKLGFHGASPVPYITLMGNNGCDHYRVFVSRNDLYKRLRLFRIKS